MAHRVSSREKKKAPGAQTRSLHRAEALPDAFSNPPLRAVQARGRAGHECSGSGPLRGLVPAVTATVGLPWDKPVGEPSCLDDRRAPLPPGCPIGPCVRPAAGLAVSPGCRRAPVCVRMVACGCDRARQGVRLQPASGPKTQGALVRWGEGCGYARSEDLALSRAGSSRPWRAARASMTSSRLHETVTKPRVAQRKIRLFSDISVDEAGDDRWTSGGWFAKAVARQRVAAGILRLRMRARARPVKAMLRGGGNRAHRQAPQACRAGDGAAGATAPEVRPVRQARFAPANRGTITWRSRGSPSPCAARRPRPGDRPRRAGSRPRRGAR